MSDTIDINMCILWEDELRIAAKALHALNDAPAGTPQDVVDKLFSDAIQASMIALFGLRDDTACLIGGAGEINRRIKRRRYAIPTGEKP